jgi:hypothetical protein
MMANEVVRRVLIHVKDCFAIVDAKGNPKDAMTSMDTFFSTESFIDDMGISDVDIRTLKKRFSENQIDLWAAFCGKYQVWLKYQNWDSLMRPNRVPNDVTECGASGGGGAERGTLHGAGNDAQSMDWLTVPGTTGSAAVLRTLHGAREETQSMGDLAVPGTDIGVLMAGMQSLKVAFSENQMVMLERTNRFMEQVTVMQTEENERVREFQVAVQERGGRLLDTTGQSILHNAAVDGTTMDTTSGSMDYVEESSVDESDSADECY